MTNPYQTPKSDPTINKSAKARDRASFENLPSFASFEYPFTLQIKRGFLSPSLEITDASDKVVLNAKRVFLGPLCISITSGLSSDHLLGKIDRTISTGGITPKIYSPSGEILAELSQPFISGIARNHSLQRIGSQQPSIRYTESRPISSFFYSLLGGFIGPNLLFTRILKTRLSILLNDDTLEAMSIEHQISLRRSSQLHKHRELPRDEEYLTLMGIVYIMLISRIRG